MSEYLNKKKESIERVNKIVDSYEANQKLKEELIQYKFKYEKLVKQYDKLNRVFDFHKGVVQNISSCIITTDTNGKITFMNKSALDLVASDSSVIYGTHIHTVFADKQDGLIFEKQAIKLEKMFDSKETKIISADGSIMPIGFSTTLLKSDVSDEVEGVIFIFREISNLITFRKHMERMDRLSTLGELSAGIAHEIRNPLAGIKAAAEVLGESFSLDDYKAQFVTIIVKGIDRCNDLLLKFFDYAKPSKPKSGYHNVRNVIEGCFFLLAPKFARRKIDFDFEIEDALPLVFIDVSQLEQVIMNLFLNAYDAMSKGGVLKVKAVYAKEELLIDNIEHHECVKLFIEDNGNGISEEAIEKIFDPFYTLKSNGVGLGLSISTRLLAENNSKIEVKSQVKKGTIFTIFLPQIKKP